MTAKPMDEQMLAAKREQYRDALENAVQQIVTALAQKPEVERAILFGSYAQGRRDLFTDLDVLIVMDSPLDFVSRTAEMYRDLSCPVDLDLLVYTPEELARNRNRGFIRRALEEGKVIYERRAA
jgi:predicted nucleotidyltransferase